MYKRSGCFLSLALLLLASILASCNNSGCYDKMDVKVKCSFYSLDSAYAVTIDSVSVWGVGSDSLVYKNKNLSEISLDLDPNSSETRYVFQVIGSGGYKFMDTITFKHVNKPWYQSAECGCMVFNTLDTCLTTGSIFQSATILEKEITNTEIETEHVILNI